MNNFAFASSFNCDESQKGAKTDKRTPYLSCHNEAGFVSNFPHDASISSS